jgi:polysaccharide biosynthesis protein PslH
MQALFLIPQLPYPPRQGSALRNYYLIKGLAEAGIGIDLLSFATPEQVADPTAGGPLRQLCRQLELVPLPPPRSTRTRLLTMLRGKSDMAARLASPAYEAALLRLLDANHYDAIQVEGLEQARNGLLVLDHLADEANRPRLILDEHNAEYLIQQRAYHSDIKQIRIVAKAVYSFVQYRRLVAFERAICRRADDIIAVSAADAAAIARLDASLTARITIIPNGVDSDEFAPLVNPIPPLPDWPRDSLVFTGLMAYRPNVDGVIWFVRQVWPLIRARKPDARFYIVGARPSRTVQALAGVPGVVVTGEVEDVIPYIGAATVYLAPLRVGGGVRLKLLQAMAMAKPIVTTSLGAEGIDLLAGRDVVVADDAASFATATVRLLEDEQERARLAASARQLSIKYDWRNLLPLLIHLYENGTS